MASSIAHEFPLLRALPARRIGVPRILIPLALGSALLLAGTAQIAATWRSVQILTREGPTAVRPFEFLLGTRRLVFAGNEARQAGLAKGDQIDAVNGRRLSSYRVLSEELERSRPGAPLSVVFTRDSATHSTRVMLRHQYGQGIVLSALLKILLPWFSLFLGSYVVLVRPRDARAWLVFALLLSFGQTFSDAPSPFWTGSVRITTGIFHFGTASLLPLWMFLFGYYFPAAPDVERTASWRKWLLIVPLLVLRLCFALANLGAYESLDRFGGFRAGIASWGALDILLLAGALAGGLVLLIRKWMRAKESDVKRRMRLLALGCATALCPGLVVIAAAALPAGGLRSAVTMVSVPALLLLLLFPITLAYVIIVERAMDVRGVIRQSLQYELAKGALITVRAAAAVITAAIAVVIVARVGYNPPRLFAYFCLAAALPLALQQVLAKLRPWLDRRYFREAYQTEQVLMELSEEVRSFVETEPLLKTVAERIAASLHVGRVTILLGSDSSLQLACAIGYDQPPPVEFRRDEAVPAVLKSKRRAARVCFDDPQSWVYATPAMNETERARLAALDTQVLVPIIGKDDMIGMVSLGPKRSDAPYSSGDIRLLESIASQTGLAIEVSRLAHTVAEQTAVRKKLDREIEIAREVQERLFPHVAPQVPGLDYTARCRSALQVGGDYYDFFSLAPNLLGFAIGDISGKGIGAALMMASLQGCLRSEANQRPESLATLMTTVNRRLYESSTASRYATLFYGEFDGVSRRLSYVNAGHIPPLLLRRYGNQWSATLLDVGGSVVGLLPMAAFSHGWVNLEPGDYLVAVTDGITEAANTAGDMWDQERLIETVTSCASRGLSASGLMEAVIGGADAFAGSEPQSDDMTVMVFRMT